MPFKVNPKTGKVSVTMPKALGPAVDMLYEMRKARMAQQAIADNIKAEETKLKDLLLKLYGKSKIQGASGSVARAEISQKDIAQVKDWPKFWAYIKRTGHFDLMQKRISDTAVKERWDRDITIPGVAKFTALIINATKKPGR